MPELTYENIIDMPLGKLKTAVDDWSDMIAKLDRLAEDARDGMRKKADKADWAGVNAGVTKAFISRTAKEFGDAAKEAKGVKAVLDDAYRVFKKAQDELTSIRDDEGPKANVHVDARGKVTARRPVQQDVSARTDSNFAELMSKEKTALAEWQARIDDIVERCEVADDSLRRALEANVSEDHNFGAPKYSSLEHEAAARAAALAGKGTALTHAQLQEQNEILRQYGTSSEFATRFYEKLGPEKSLEFFGQLSTDTYGDYGKLDKQRLKDVQELQQNLGLTLASASQDKAFTTEWGPELRKLGTQQIPLSPYGSTPPYGYQLLGGIMRYGNYDPKFLNPIAEHVAQLHQKKPDFFASSKPMGGLFENQYNPSGVNGSGYDPMVSMLEALGHSPEASKEFFTADPTAYNEDGSVGEGEADLGETKDGDPIERYLNLFGSKEYTSFPDTEATDPGHVKEASRFLPDALGHALESATLGYPWDEPSANGVRDETTAEVTELVVQKYGEDPELLKHQEALSDSLGRIGAGYIGDIDNAISNRGDGVFAPSEDRHKHASIDQQTAFGFLSALGQHPDAYAAITTAQQVHTTSVLEAQVGANGAIDEGFAREAVSTGAAVQGQLDEARAGQVKAEGLEKHKEYKDAQEKGSAWISFGTTAAIGGAAVGAVAFLPPVAAVGAAAILVPLATDTATGAVQQIASQVIGGHSGDSIDEKKSQIDELTQTERRAVYQAGELSANAPMERFISYHGIGSSSDFGQDLWESVQFGYNSGAFKEQRQGYTPQTE
ncbi:hypothetical protein PUR57_36870 [Streptomyces sp. JV176]|uniref:hypothetical protein n=1 Tax=Streptomyces sp. JV176 TaxID=858630 RepID=UPI002E786875|nr:hypothetical protein [Streptomyces sp. JV176]MEE1804187.1 hypothetical protein [Streptomyces sp. JV176]